MATTPTPQELLSQAFISDPTLLSTSIAANGWSDWTDNTSPYVKEQIKAASDKSSEIAGHEFTMAGENIINGRQLTSDYNSIYRPAGADYGKLVNEMGTEAYRSKQRGAAMADVQQQADAAMQANQRSLQRMGVNPNSGRALAMNNQNALQTALGKAAAASNSDRATRSAYAAGLKDMNNMGLDTLKAQQAMDGSAQKWATLGLDANKLGATMGIDYAKLSGSQASSFGDLANKAAYTKNVNATTAANLQAIKDSNSIGNLLLSAGVKAGSTALNGAVDSGMKWLTGSIGNALSGSPEPTDMTGFQTQYEPITYAPTPVDTSAGLQFDDSGLDDIFLATQ